MHAKIILAQDVAEYAPLFSEIADAYFEREMYAEAGHIYEMLGGDAGVRILAGRCKADTVLTVETRRPAACTYSCKLRRADVWLET